MSAHMFTICSASQEVAMLLQTRRWGRKLFTLPSHPASGQSSVHWKTLRIDYSRARIGGPPNWRSGVVPNGVFLMSKIRNFVWGGLWHFTPIWFCRFRHTFLLISTSILLHFGLQNHSRTLPDAKSSTLDFKRQYNENQVF